MTRLFRSFCAAVLLLCVATWANALVPTVAGYYVNRYTSGSASAGGSGTIYPGQEAACASSEAADVGRLMGQDAGLGQLQSMTWTSGSCRAQFSTTYRLVPVSSAPATCPANSTAVTGGCQCKAGYDESNGQCVAHVNQCTSKTGQVGILSWTEGYTRTPDEGDRQAVGPIMTPPASGEVCDGGCAVSLQTSGPGVQPYVSQYPTANGLYRRSVDYPSLGLGRECTMGAADAGAKKDAPPPDCPGSVGDLGNGKPVCVGTAAKPITPTPLGAAPGATPIAGNPPAGGKPPTGEGSGTGSAGRTPTTGNGTATGGPAAAATGGKGGGAGGTAAGVGTGGSGTGDEPHKPCGGPGEPTCNVKIDETGVPAGAGTSYDSASKAINDSATDTQTKINAARDRTDGPAWSFTFALPAGCSPYPVGIGEVVLDVCRYQGTIHDLLSMVWAAVTAFTIIGMVGRTIRGT